MIVATRVLKVDLQQVIYVCTSKEEGERNHWGVLELICGDAMLLMKIFSVL